MVITIRSILLSFITCQWVCKKGNTAGVNSKAGTVDLFRTPEITNVYSGLVELIRYARASSNYSDFLKRHLHLRNRLLDQGFEKICLIRSLKKFIFRYQDLVEIYSVSAEKILNDGFSYSENV